MYVKQREDLNISHQIGASLGPNPDNETDTIKFLETIKLLKLLKPTFAMYKISK